MTFKVEDTFEILVNMAVKVALSEVHEVITLPINRKIDNDKNSFFIIPPYLKFCYEYT